MPEQQTNNSDCILREHNVVLNKYGQDLYIDEEIITSNYPDEKGRKENCLKLLGSLEFLMDKKHPDNHSVFLTVDGVRELSCYLKMWLEKQKGDSV